ncbi:class I SAM-dependent methyltransferase [Azospirillum sp. B4]|uniref:class I SAM-dependent methyltransferase n=1 Tax=Azospirillum sp. B4 TaxID=95605 RepID=UPI00034ADAC9|nr:phospholipid methyltransferase [Azospirillum sp. B4]
MPTDRAETTLNGKKFAARASAKSGHPRGHGPRPHNPAHENPAWLFFRRWAANPVGIASITPSAPSLGRLMARHVRRDADEIVVEYGGGTGAITRALLDSGIPASRLFVIERDKELHAYMTAKFPGVTVLLGDVKDVRTLLPPQWVGRVGTIVCGIPMILIPAEAQRQIMDEAYAVMPPGRQFLSFTYSLRSPLRRQALNLTGKRLGWAMSNIPPAAVWGYTRG